jgi:histidinol dehydrogenase
MLARSDLRGVADLASALAPPPDDTGPLRAVREILDEVRTRGDDALRDFTERFDGCRIDELRVPAGEITAAVESLPADVRDALEYAHGEIAAYHAAQRTGGFTLDRDGVRLTERVVPVARAGCYVPGGRAAYPSTVLMTAVPARIAGVDDVVLCVPPDTLGRVPAVTLAAAALAGVDEVYRVGGAQAIAAMAYGTDSIRAVDVIVGPGNVYVALAKREVAGVVGIDGFNGPSEVAIVADHSVVAAVDEAVERLLAESPHRDEIASTLRATGLMVIVDDADAARIAVDVLAPEHLELACADADKLADDVRNAGAIFVGNHAPAALGDYLAGVNHVLPTARTARFASALRVDTFCKHVHVVEVDAPAFARVAPAVVALASVEGLVEHARSVTIRAGESTRES